MEDNNHEMDNLEYSDTDETGDTTIEMREILQSDDHNSSAITGDTTLSFRRGYSLDTIDNNLDYEMCHEENPTSNRNQFRSSSSNSFNDVGTILGRNSPESDFEESIYLSRNVSVGSSNEDLSFPTNDEFLYGNVNDDIVYDSTDTDSDSDESVHHEENEVPPSFAKLLEMMAKDDSNSIITANFVVNKIEVLLAIMKFSTKYSLPNSAVADLCKMFNAFIDKPIIPDSRYKIDKLVYPGDGIKYYAVCSHCKNFIQEYTKKDMVVVCKECDNRQRLNDPSYHDFFVVTDYVNELRHLLESNDDYYVKVMNNRDFFNQDLVDFHSGRKYKEFLQSLPEHCKHSYVTLNFNSDGSPIFKSSKFSVWPIQINANEIPPSIRNKKPITYALWFGKDKPNMNIFLLPFVRDINKLSEDGINCRINNEMKNIKVFAVCCCVDTVARPTMQGFIQFNGYYGCGWCLHPGEAVIHNNKSTVKYPIIDNIPPKRTEENTMQYIEELIATGSVSVKGVKRGSQLLLLRNFNIIDGFVPDAMHCVALGIAKQFSNYWFQPSDQPFRISKEDINNLNKYIKALKVPTEIARLSRPISDRKYWKSREWENWILYYSLPLLKEIHGFQKYSKHWALLVESFYILMNDSITFDELHRADKLLKEFMYKTQIYYSKNAMTFNVHQLIHITQSVADWGPLWAHIGYPFESGNGQIVRSVHAAKGVLSQMCRNLSVKESVIIMQEHIASKDESPVRDYCEYLETRYTKKSIKIGKNRYFCKKPLIDGLHLAEINILPGNVRSYGKLIKNNCVFKSCNKVLQRSDNSFALTYDNEYIQVVQFLINDWDEMQYTVYKSIDVENDFYNTCSSIKKIISISENLKVLDTSRINKICVVISVKNNHYISAVPNICPYS